jgi:hypothetical protein
VPDGFLFDRQAGLYLSHDGVTWVLVNRPKDCDGLSDDAFGAIESGNLVCDGHADIWTARLPEP